jgi:hypothetical protein
LEVRVPHPYLPPQEGRVLEGLFYKERFVGLHTGLVSCLILNNSIPYQVLWILDYEIAIRIDRAESINICGLIRMGFGNVTRGKWLLL